MWVCVCVCACYRRLPDVERIEANEFLTYCRRSALKATPCPRSHVLNQGRKRKREKKNNFITIGSYRLSWVQPVSRWWLASVVVVSVAWSTLKNDLTLRNCCSIIFSSVDAAAAAAGNRFQFSFLMTDASSKQLCVCFQSPPVCRELISPPTDRPNDQVPIVPPFPIDHSSSSSEIESSNTATTTTTTTL